MKSLWHKIAKRGKALVLMSALMVTACFTGCGSTKSDTDLSDKVKEFNDSIVKTGADDTAGNSDIVVGSVNMGMNGEWFSEVMNGIKTAGSDLGVTLKMLDSESDTDKERENINQLLAEGMDVLVISPIGGGETEKSLEPVIAAGIPIITWNTTVNLPVTCAVGVDATALGGDTGDFVTEYIKTNNLSNVNLAIIGDTFYEIGIARCEGFKEAISSLVDSGIINIVAEDQAETLDAGVEVTEKILNNNSVDMIWAWNQGALLGAIEGVKKTGQTDVVVMGTDMSMDLAYDMLSDDVNLQAVTTQLPYNMGYKAIVTAVKAAKHQEVDKQILIPLSTYTKSDVDRIEQYIVTHENLVD